MAALFGSKPTAKSPEEPEGSNIWTAASDGDLKRVKQIAAKASSLAMASKGAATGSQSQGEASEVSREAIRACLSEKDEHGYTAIHAAASYGHVDLLLYLLKTGGVSPDLRDEDGDTALHVCSSKTCAEHLLAAGASGSAKNDEGQSPGEAIRERIFALLRELHASVAGDKDEPSIPATVQEESEDVGGGDDLAKIDALTQALKELGLHSDTSSQLEELDALFETLQFLATLGHSTRDEISLINQLIVTVVSEIRGHSGSLVGSSGGGSGGASSVQKA